MFTGKVSETMMQEMYAAVALALLFTIVSADFEPIDIVGTWRYNSGNEGSFGSVVRFKSVDLRDLAISPKNIVVDGEQCEKGQIVLRNRRDDGNNLTKHLIGLDEDDVGSFIIGKVSSNIECPRGTVKFPTDYVINWVETDDDVTVSFNTVFTTGDLKEVGNYKFDDETKYAVFGGNAVFRKSSSICFPGWASVELESGETRRMDQVKVGDRVKVSEHGEYSDVLMWTHKSAKEIATFVKLDTLSGHSITLTPGHFIYVNDELRQARHVRSGDVLRVADGLRSPVVSIMRMKDQGVYNPQTTHGDIVVDGIVASTYTKTIKPESAHALLTPLRAMYRMWSTLVNGFAISGDGAKSHMEL